MSYFLVKGNEVKSNKLDGNTFIAYDESYKLTDEFGNFIALIKLATEIVEKSCFSLIFNSVYISERFLELVIKDKIFMKGGDEN